MVRYTESPPSAAETPQRPPSPRRGVSLLASLTTLLTVLLLTSQAVFAQTIPAGGSGIVTASSAFFSATHGEGTIDHVTYKPYLESPPTGWSPGGNFTKWEPDSSGRYVITESASEEDEWAITNSSGNVVASYAYNRSSTTNPPQGGGQSQSSGTTFGATTLSNAWSAFVEYHWGLNPDTCGYNAIAYVRLTVPSNAAPGQYTVSFSERFHQLHKYLVENKEYDTDGMRSSTATFTVGAASPGVPSAPVLSLTGRNRNGGAVDTTLQWTPTSGTILYKLRRSLVPGGPYTDDTRDFYASGFGTTQEAKVSTQSSSSAYPENQRTYFYVVVAINSYGESSLSNEVRVSPTGLAYVNQGASGNIPNQLAANVDTSDPYQYRRWIIYDAAGNQVAAGNNGQTVNGWRADITKTVVYVPAVGPGTPVCNVPGTVTPAHTEIGYNISVTAPAGALPLPNYSVVSIAPYYTGSPSPQQPYSPDRVECQGYFDVLGTAPLVKVTDNVHDFVTWIPSEIFWHSQPSNGWTSLGAIGSVVTSEFADTGLVPIYRATRPDADRVLTFSVPELEYNANAGYIKESIVFYLYINGGGARKPLYRFWDSSTGIHHYTTDTNLWNNPPPNYVKEGLLGYTAY